eukprot:734441_1
MMTQNAKSPLERDSIPIKEWTTQNAKNMVLRDEIYGALVDQGVITIGDMKQCTMTDMEEIIKLTNQRQEFQKKINVMERRKIINLKNKVSASDPKNVSVSHPKQHTSSIENKIETFETMLKNEQSKENIV